MFNVKHNNKDNILHVHIGDRTHAGAHRQPAAPAATQAGDMARIAYRLATIYIACYYIDAGCLICICQKKGLTASSVRAIL